MNSAERTIRFAEVSADAGCDHADQIGSFLRLENVGSDIFVVGHGIDDRILGFVGEHGRNLVHRVGALPANCQHKVIAFFNRCADVFSPGSGVRTFDD